MSQNFQSSRANKPITEKINMSEEEKIEEEEDIEAWEDFLKRLENLEERVASLERVLRDAKMIL